MDLVWRAMAALASDGDFSRSERAELKVLLSAGRLEPYRLAVPRHTDEGALKLYLWNADVSSAFYTDIAFVEVVLRNAIDVALRNLFGRDHWYWDPTARDYIAELSDRSVNGLRTAHGWLGKTATIDTYSAGKVVAELTFGFWAGLLEAGGPRGGHNGPFVDYSTTLWLPTGHVGEGVRFAFPGLAQPSRRLAHRHVSLIAEMRNRIAHHEPVFAGVRRKGSQVTDPLVSLVQIHDNILELAGWISPAARSWIERTSTFTAVYHRRP